MCPTRTRGTSLPTSTATDIDGRGHHADGRRPGQTVKADTAAAPPKRGGRGGLDRRRGGTGRLRRERAAGGPGRHRYGREKPRSASACSAAAPLRRHFVLYARRGGDGRGDRRAADP